MEIYGKYEIREEKNELQNGIAALVLVLFVVPTFGHSASVFERPRETRRWISATGFASERDEFILTHRFIWLNADSRRKRWN